MDAQLRKQLTQTITVQNKSTVDQFGEITYGAPVNVKARVDIVNEIGTGGRGGALNSRDGQELRTNFMVITESEIRIDSLITYFGPTPRLPISVVVYYDEKGGIDHYETRI